MKENTLRKYFIKIKEKHPHFGVLMVVPHGGPETIPICKQISRGLYPTGDPKLSIFIQKLSICEYPPDQRGTQMNC